MTNFHANNIISNSIRANIGRSRKLNHIEVSEKYNEGMTIDQLAKNYNVTTMTIRNTLKRANVVFNSQRFDRDEMINMYNKGIPIIHIAMLLNVTPPAISSALKAQGIKTGSTRGPMSKYEDDIIDLWNKGFSCTEIKNRLGITYSTVHKFVRRNFGQPRIIDNADGTTKVVKKSVVQNTAYPPDVIRREVIYN